MSQIFKRLAGVSVLVMASQGFADGTEVLGSPSIAIADGSGFVSAGVGLIDGQPMNVNIDIPGDATINQVLLYTEGMFASAAESPATMSMEVAANAVTLDRIGGPTVIKPAYTTATYRADITALGVVAPGSNSVAVGGVDFTVDNDGIGLIVIFEQRRKQSVIDIRDGSDYAFSELPGALAVTEAQVFTFAASPKDRLANLDFFVGSVSGGNGSGSSCRPNSFEVEIDGSTSVFSDQLDSEDGLFWDTVRLSDTVPAGATQLSVQVFSRDDGFLCPGNKPASLAWVTAALSLETPSKKDCWITTGGFHNSGDPSGAKDFTFGGNVGPPPRGSWQVVDHNSGDNFHAFDVSIVSCDVITLTGPDQPGGKKGFTINQASFEGVGRLNHVDGFPFTGFVQDAGEPAGKNGNNQDFFSITVRDPGDNAIVFEASATLDGGNVQIHPPTGKN